MENPCFGVDYYPEHWPRERWQTDASLMRQMGVKVARMAEFSWHKLEPKEGEYSFGWLDEVIALLAEYGISTVLGTPTAAPPAWLVNAHPEILPVDTQGRVRGFGGRHHDCQSSPVYREYVREIVTAMARHFASNPNVIGWQVDNELGNSHGDLCTCQSCRSAFQSWLRKRYGTVQELNRAWGTAFWSQEYNDFGEVFAPRITVTGENPSAMLDWKRFHSDLITDFCAEQTAILHKECPNKFITHNFMGFADTVDYYKLASQLDFVSHDQYPTCFCNAEPFIGPAAAAAPLDVVRGYRNAPFWVMEQQAGPTGWQVLGRTPAPGELRLWTAQSIAHGADTVVYFRWRSCTVGTEQYWHGILPHSGKPGRRYAELKKTAQEFAPLMRQMEGAMPQNEVGMVHSFEQGYAFAIQPHHPQLSYTNELLRYYRALYSQNIPVDFVPENGDFARYKLLIAPLQFIMTPELAAKYRAYVQNGGHLLLTMRTGVKDENDLCITESELPAFLTDVAGVTVADYDCLRDGPVKTTQGSGSLWADILATEPDTQVLARYGANFYAGEPCATQHAYGEGRCYYIGTAPDDAWCKNMFAQAAAAVGVGPLGSAESGVELAAREKNGTRWIFALNHNAAAASFEPKDGWELLFGDGTEAGKLPPYGVQVFRTSK